MSVDIEPLELNFRRPFTVEVPQTLTIKNPNSTPLAFKVKTTAPRQYVVRPNAGRIEPGSDFDVSVLLQPMKADPAPDAKCRDKFLVQSAPITGDKEFESVASVLEKTDKSLLQERKIRVNWLSANPDDDKTHGTPRNVAATPNKQSLSNGASDTPDANRYSSPGTSSGPPPYTSDDNKDEDDESSDANKSAIATAAATATSAAQMTYEEIKAKLAQAEAQIASLKDNSGLRQRNVKGAAAEGKAQAAQAAQAVKQSVEGVPVQLVALLCIFSFLLAYFFF